MPGSDEKPASSGRGKKRKPEAGGKPRRPGLPAESSILSEKLFTSPKKRTYRIIHTSETDATDKDEPVKKTKPGEKQPP